MILLDARGRQRTYVMMMMPRWLLAAAICCSWNAGEAAKIRIDAPSNGSYVLPSVNVAFGIVVADAKEAEQVLRERQVCVEIVSLYFDRRRVGCVSVESNTVNMNRMPYGEHRIHLCLAEKNVVDVSSCARVFVRVTPLLPAFTPATKAQCSPRAPRAECTATLPSVSVCVLVHRGGDAFAKAAASWHESGLLRGASETLVFLQEWPLDLDDEMARVRHTDVADARISRLPEAYGMNVIGSREQLGISGALERLVRAARSDIILFLEEDFGAYSDAEMAAERLQAAVRAVACGDVDVVKLRHRKRPGLPFYPYVWRGREASMLSIDTPYVSNHSALEVVHWMDEPPFPREVLWKCAESLTCAFSTHAGWSNNPFVARRQFLREHVLPAASADWTTTIEGALNLSPHLWDDKCFVLAQGEGIFTHADTDRGIVDQSPYENPWDANGAVARRRRSIDDWAAQ